MFRSVDEQGTSLSYLLFTSCKTSTQTQKEEDKEKKQKPKKKQKQTQGGGSKQQTAAAEDKIEGMVDFDANLLMDFNDDASMGAAAKSPADLDSVLASAQAEGVVQFVTPSVGLPYCAEVRQVAARHPCVVATAGVHPYWAAAAVDGAARDGGADCTPAAVAELRGHAQHDEVAFVGECGLDASPGFPPLDVQLPWFDAQVGMACQLRKPLFLHERKACRPFVDVLQKWKQTHPDGLPPVVVHCFTGTEEDLATYRDPQLDFYIGVTGPICDPKKPDYAAQLRSWLPRHVPLDRLVVETDAPYMGWKGCRASCAKKRTRTYPNVPAALPQIVRAAAACYGVAPQELADATRANVQRLLKYGRRV